MVDLDHRRARIRDPYSNVYCSVVLHETTFHFQVEYGSIADGKHILGRGDLDLLNIKKLIKYQALSMYEASKKLWH